MMNDYDYQNSADAYDFGGATAMYEGTDHVDSLDNLGNRHLTRAAEVDFEDDKISSLPKILLMGPRRGGKTSIQVCSREWLVPIVKSLLQTSFFCALP